MRRILILFKWLMALGLVGGLLFAAYVVNGLMRAERAAEGEEDRIEAPRRVVDGVVKLGTEQAERSGLAEAPARAAEWTERVPLYGQVVDNPASMTEVRSPFAGTLREAADVPWPAPGRWVRAGQTLGWIDVRVGPQERLTLRDNLTTALLKKQGAEKVVALQRERVKRVESVSRSQIVPGQQLDDARVLLVDAETQLAIASASVELWRKALAEADRPGHHEPTTFSQPLIAPADGEIVDLTARPGEAIEAGAAIGRLVDSRRVLVRLDIPPALLGAGPPGPLKMEAIAAGFSSGQTLAGSAPPPDASTIEAIPVGPAPRVDEASQFIGYWYERERDRDEGAGKPGKVETGSGGGDGPGMLWRPGLQVRAWMTPRGAPKRPAVAIPAEALLFHQGRSLVYVRVEPGEYRRREVRTLGRVGDSSIVAARRRDGPDGLDPGEFVVSRGAQVLLSE
ncbi:MAG: efflux RND transporter periplasmic adaptor subunit, partial [Isosphaeraceae bacterium]